MRKDGKLGYGRVDWEKTTICLAAATILRDSQAHYMTLSHNSTRESLQHLEIPILPQTCSDYSDARRASGTAAPPFWKNNQIFKDRDTEKRRD